MPDLSQFSDEELIRIATGKVTPSQFSTPDNRNKYVAGIDTATGSPAPTKDISSYSDEELTRIATGKKPLLTAADKLSDITSRPGQLVPFWGGISEGIELGKVGLAAYRYKNNTATEDDANLLRDFVDQSERDTTFGYKLVNVLSQLPSFAGEMATTMGVYTAGKTAATKVMKEGLEWLLKKESKDILKKAIPRAAIGFAGGVAGGTLQTIPAASTRIYAETKRRMLPQIGIEPATSTPVIGKEGEALPKALGKAAISQWVEVVSEHGGGMLPQIARLLPEKVVNNAVVNVLKKVNPAAKLETLRKLAESTGWHGVWGEVFEERLADIGRAVTGLEDFKLPTPEQFAVEFTAFSIPGIAGRIVERGQKSPTPAEQVIESEDTAVEVTPEETTPPLPEASPDFVGPRDILPRELQITQPQPRLIKKPDTSVEDYLRSRGEVTPFMLATHELLTISPEEAKADLKVRLTKAGVSGKMSNIIDSVTISRPSDIKDVTEAVGKAYPDLAPEVVAEIEKTKAVLRTWQDEQLRSLFKKNKNILNEMEKEIASGRPGGRIFNYDVGGQGGTPDVIGIPSTYPEYFRNKGLVARNILDIIWKARNGKRLTENQQATLEDLIRDKRAYNLEEIQLMRESKVRERMKPQEVIEDGETISADPFDRVPVDKGITGIGHRPATPKPIEIKPTTPVSALDVLAQEFGRKETRHDKEDIQRLQGGIGEDREELGRPIPDQERGGGEIKGGRVFFRQDKEKGLTGETIPTVSGEEGIVREEIKGYGEAEPAPAFYSQMQRVLEAKLPGKGHPLAFRELIKGWTNKGEFKQDEYEWSGVDEWLSGQKGTITKQEVIDWLKANEIRVKEVEKSDERIRLSKRLYQIDEELQDEDLTENDREVLEAEYDKLSRMYKEKYEDTGLDIKADTRFSNLTLPGGTNYKELLLMLPTKKYSPKTTYEQWRRENPYSPGRTWYDLVYSESKKHERRYYQSPHWEELNVLAHIRFNERTDTEGKRVLFIEEIQSDWHQEGKKKGYKGPELTTLPEGYRVDKAGSLYFVNTPGGPHLPGSQAETEEDAIREALDTLNRGRIGVPPAPFSKTWHELVLKRILRWGGENGFDRVAWTTGEMQAERYDLSKQVDEVVLEGKNLIAYKNNEEVINKSIKSDEEVSDYIGKEPARKLLSQEGTPIPGSPYVRRSISGFDLKVGGEWANRFYDEIIPQFLNKYGKKWGARVGTTTVDATERREFYMKREYSGPTPTIEQVKEVYKLSKSHGPDIWTSPITGERLNLPLNRVGNEQSLRQIINGMEEGKSFNELVTEYGVDEEIFGGAFVLKESPTWATIPSIDITPSMKKSVLYEGQALFEEKAGYGEGLISKPDMEVIKITGEEISDSNKEWLFRPALREYAKQYLGQVYLNKDTGWDLRVNKDGYRRITGGPGLTIDDMRAVAALPQLIENAVLAESHPDREGRQEIESIHRFYAPLGIGVRLFRVKLTVKKYKDTRIDKNLYSLDTIEIESPAVNAHAPDIENLQAHERPAGLPSTISIADLLKNAIKSDGSKFYETSTQGEVKETQEVAHAEAKRELDRITRISTTKRGMGSGVRNLGVGIRRDLIQKGRIDLRGQEVKTTEDLAVLAQVYRSPQFETFRIFYIKDGRIVAHEGTSSRMPGVSVALAGDPNKAAYKVIVRAERLGADSFYFLHNHPSGDPSPSSGDFIATEQITKKISEIAKKSGQNILEFKGHVVINSGKYAVITQDLKEEMHAVPSQGSERLIAPEGAHEALNRQIRVPKDVANIGQALKIPESFVIIIYRGAKAEVRAISELPINLFNKPKDVKGYLRNRAREFGAVDVFAYYDGSNSDLNKTYAAYGRVYIQVGILRDAIFGDSSVWRGRLPNIGAGQWMGQKAVEVAVRVSEEVDKYIKAGWAPKKIVDRIFRLPFKAIGKLDADGRWRWGVMLHNKLVSAVTEKDTAGRYPMVDRLLDTVREGLIDKYGMPEEYIGIRNLREMERNAISQEGLEFFHELRNLGEDQLRTINDILTNKDMDSGQWESLTEPIRNLIIHYGQEMVDAQILSPQAFERNKAQYLHRSYEKYRYETPAIQHAFRKIRLIGRELKHRGKTKYVSPKEVIKWVNGEKDGKNWEYRGVVERQFYEGQTLVKKGSAIIWRDWTKEERQEMGEIEDAAYNVAMTFDLIAKDLSTGRLYKRIADDQLLSSTKYVKGWVPFGNEKISESSTPKWGALADHYVHPAVARDLKLTEKYSQPSMWRWLLTQWKLNKTARNPVVHTNNIVSNFFLADMHDIGASDLASGIKSYAQRDPYFEEARSAGVFGHNIIQAELRRFYHPEISRRGNALEKAVALLKKGDAAMINLYSKADDIFRMALFKKLRLDGKSVEEAAAEARRQFIDYDISAPWILAARNTIVPFISYSYRAVPLIAEVALTRPWKLVKYAALFTGLQAATAAMLGINDDDERKLLQDWYKGRTWVGVKKMVRIPWGYLDISRWLPGADVFDVTGSRGMIPFVNIGGPIDIGMSLYHNYDPFTERPITRENMPIDRKAEDISLWIYRQLGPNAPWVPKSHSWEKIVKAYKGVTDELGRPLSPETAIPSTLGIKITPFDPELQRLRITREIRKDIDEARTVIQQAEWRLSRGEITRDEFDEIRNEQRAILRRHEERMKDIDITARKLMSSGAYAPGP